MKKRIAVFIAIVLAITLVTGTVAFAASYAPPGQGGQGGQGGPSAQPSSQPSDQGKGQTDRVQERQQFLEQVKPLLQQIAQNRLQLRTMKTELATVRKQAGEHLKGLKSNPQAITDEQIQLMKTLRTRLQDCRQLLGDTNPDMVQQRSQLRQMRRSRNYDAILAAYGNILRVQEERMQQISDLIEINEQIAAI